MKGIKWLHFICLFLALADLVLFIRWGISFRGQWADILLSFAPFITALIVLSGYAGTLRPWAKIYFISFSIINTLLFPLYLFAGAFYPLEVYNKANGYEARQRMGILASPAADLIRKQFIFEKAVARHIDFAPEHTTASGKQMQIVFKPDSVGLALPLYDGHDTAIFFRK